MPTDGGTPLLDDDVECFGVVEPVQPLGLSLTEDCSL